MVMGFLKRNDEIFYNTVQPLKKNYIVNSVYKDIKQTLLN